jgi:RHH-type proline utilization regulon transcriptional repressor/proline dehydrogenase/delta 1-pyrroline-5-carboxylate dehydrogenase
MGWATRNYVPIGSLIVGMAYLVRRIMENSSQVGVLTIMRSHKKAQELSSPEVQHNDKIAAGSLERDPTQSHLSEKFFNVTPVRLYREEERYWVEKALQDFRDNQLGKNYNNPQKLTGSLQTIISSSDPELKVGEITFAQSKDVKKVLKNVDEQFSEGEWSGAGVRGFILRCNTIIKASHLMLARRNELSALICYEAGKAVAEALADVDEAIDFLHFYAREEVRLHRHGELIKPRGPSVVICPWNFPLAIPCGMSSSNLLAGNPVILKSAEQTPLISQSYVDLMHEAGVPKNALIHLPGFGEEVGPSLISAKEIAGIVFTGSKPVGMMIAQKASQNVYHNKRYELSYPVRVITEMGGKNAVIVTGSAELDETVAGVLYSAFAHAGQKCSAASRVLVHRPVMARFKERLSQAVMDLNVGAAYDFSTAVNPVISKEDKQRIQQTALECREEIRLYGGEVVVDRTNEELPGFCVGPSVFEVDPLRALHSDSFAMREVFGPMVHLIPFDNLDHALEIYNGTEYALTGGVFSQSQDEIDYLSERMESGNVYVNRNVTGARVGIEPFGGFKLSGTGPKAGGRSYLRAFHFSKNLEVLDLSVPKDDPKGLRPSEYRFDLARPSGLSSVGRAQRLVKSLEVFYVRYEQLFKTVDGDHKLVLEKFKKWMAKNMIDFVETEHHNKKIPGQISVNNHHLVKEHALVLAYSPRPSFVTFLQVLSAVAMGTGVTIVARNQVSYQWWSQVVEVLNLNGFSRENVDVYYATKERADEALSGPLLSTVVYDGDREGLETVLKDVYQHLPNALRMRHVMTSFDSADIRDFKRFCEHFICVRSFAINTMRHGAPLSLELI